MQKLGQHFLKNISTLRLIATTLHPQKNEVVIEIGPGHGELTEQLLAAEGAFSVTAIERDEKFCVLLRKKFEGENRMTVIEGDALELLPSMVNESKFKALNYKIVGNIPYYITGHLFRIISELEHPPIKCVFTIQKEVAERICAGIPKMNRLAASVQHWATPSIIKILPATDFNPKPKVASAIILLETKQPVVSEPAYYAAVRTLFAQPRKTIINNLEHGTKQEKKILLEKLVSLAIPPNCRPQDLTIENISAIGKIFFS